MAEHHAVHSAEVVASPRVCFEVITDYERVVEWQRSARWCEVVRRDESGRGAEVDWTVAAPIGAISYRLAYEYDEPRRVTGSLVQGSIPGLVGEWLFEEAPAAGGAQPATLVTFDVRIDPGRFAPRPLVRMVEEQVVKGTLDDFRARAESVAAAR